MEEPPQVSDFKMKSNVILVIIFCFIVGMSYSWTQFNRPESLSSVSDQQILSAELQPILKNFQALENQTHLEKTAFLEHELLADPQFIYKLTQYLLNIKEIKDDSTETILFRSSVINILEELLRLKTLSKVTEQVETSLWTLIISEVSETASPFTQRLLMTEKFEETLILSRNNPILAKKTLKSLKDTKIKNTLKQALIQGIIEAGIPESEASAFLKEI